MTKLFGSQAEEADREKVRREVEEFAKKSKMKPVVGGRCPCGGVFLADREVGVEHSIPTCKEFDNKEADEYLLFVRLSYSE